MRISFLPAVLLAALPARAALVIHSGTLNTVIPDDTDTGIGHVLSTSSPLTLTGVTVSLNLSVPAGESGWFGDLYGYVQHDTGLAVLLNRSGRTLANPTGYNDSQTVAITFAESAANGDIHSYRSVVTGSESIALSGALSGTWQPSGRATDPATALDTQPRTALLSSFHGLSASGNWTLFLADLSGGDRYRLDSWSVSLEGVSPVPEPAAVGLVVGLALAAFAILRRPPTGQPEDRT